MSYGFETSWLVEHMYHQDLDSVAPSTGSKLGLRQKDGRFRPQSRIHPSELWTNFTTNQTFVFVLLREAASTQSSIP